MGSLLDGTSGQGISCGECRLLDDGPFKLGRGVAENSRVKSMEVALGMSMQAVLDREETANKGAAPDLPSTSPTPTNYGSLASG